MPDFDFDAFNHDQPLDGESDEAPSIAAVTGTPVVATETPVVPIAASSITNTSATEEVDKW